MNVFSLLFFFLLFCAFWGGGGGGRKERSKLYENEVIKCELYRYPVELGTYWVLCCHCLIYIIYYEAIGESKRARIRGRGKMGGATMIWASRRRQLVVDYCRTTFIWLLHVLVERLNFCLQSDHKTNQLDHPVTIRIVSIELILQLECRHHFSIETKIPTLEMLPFESMQTQKKSRFPTLIQQELATHIRWHI